MPRKQSTARPTGTIQKFIGTAYDEMKVLYDNLAALLSLEEGMSYGLRYLGPGGNTPPTVRADGSAIEDGDYYFNTEADALVYYDAADNTWFEVDPAEVMQARDDALASALVAEASKVEAEAAQLNAETSATVASTHEANALLYSDAAKVSELASGLSAITAEDYASQTLVDASNTAADVISTGDAALNADNSASTAGIHATTANQAATNAAISAQKAEQAFDSFDDRYLGAFSVAPTTDNDGDPLKTGATYYDEVDDNVYYWNGNAWESPDKAATDAAQAASSSAESALVSSGNANASATAALTSETRAKISETAALDSKNAAEVSELGAETAETNAVTSASSASTSANQAKQSEDNALASKIVAVESADRAEQFAAGGNGLTKVAHEVARELRKREYAGSGFAEWGKHHSTLEEVNQGIWTYSGFSSWANQFAIGNAANGAQGDSRTDYPIAIVDGVEHTIEGVVSDRTDEFNYIQFPQAPDGSKSLNPTTGEVHKYHDLAGVGEAYETYSVDFDGSTYIDLTAVPYNMAVGAKVEFKFKWDGTTGGKFILDTTSRAVQMYLRSADSVLIFLGFSEVKVNGTVTPNAAFTPVADVEYHFECTSSVVDTINVIGAAFNSANPFTGEIWDIKLEDPALTAVGIPPRHYLNADWQNADADALDNAVVVDKNGFTTEDWTPTFDSVISHIQLAETWLPKVGDEITFVWTPTDTSTQFALGNSVSNDVWFGITDSSNAFYWGDNTRWDVYQNGQLITYSNYVVTPNETYHLRMVRKDIDTTIGFDRIGKNQGESTQGTTGSIRDVRFTDNTNPENSRHYPLVINSATQPDTLVAEDAAYDKDTAPFYTPDYGVGTNAEIVSVPIWSADVSEIKLKFKLDAATTGDFHFLYDCSINDDVRQNFYIAKESLTVYLGGAAASSVTLNGVPVSLGSTTVEIGVEYELVIGNNIPVSFDVLGRHHSVANRTLQGKMWDIELTDKTDSTNSRYYPSIDYRLDGDTSGTVLEETLKPEHLNEPDFNSQDNWSPGVGSRGTVTFNSGSVTINNNQRTTGTGTQNIFQPLPLVTGDLYELEVVIDTLDTPAIRIGLGNAGASSGVSGLNLTTTGTHNFTLTASDASASAVYVYCTGETTRDTSCTVSRVSLKKVNDGTLVNFPSGSEWTLAQIDGATDGTLENFTVGSEWDNDLVSDGTIVGTTLRTPMTLQDAQKCFLEAKYTDFEPIISRKDLVFLETWREKVVGFVRPFGNVQFGGSTHDGVTLVPVTNFVAQGYSAFGAWDTTTVGEVADWDSMSVEEKAVWVGNPKNNLFFDAEDNEFYQECYRIRVVEGLGDDWAEVRPNDSSHMLMFSGGGFTRYVLPRGALDTPDGRDYSVWDNSYVGNLHGAGDKRDVGSFLMEVSDSAISDSRESLRALPIALVQRLNQGAYHPTYNPNGCGVWRAAGLGIKKWHSADFDTVRSQMSSSKSFEIDSITISASSISGHIGSSRGTGRSDQYDSHDAIYAGQIEDLRLNANKQDYSRLLTDRVRDGVAGATRGKGKVPFTKVFETSYDTAYQLGRTLLYFTLDTINLYYRSLGSGGRPVNLFVNTVNGRYRIDEMASNANGDFVYLGTEHGDVRTDFVIGNKYCLDSQYELSTEYDSLPWVDIIGDPVRIAATFPDGVVGQWVAADYSTPTTYDLNEKSTGAYSDLAFTSDDGATWVFTAWNINSTTNRTTSNLSVGVVGLHYYETLSAFTESDDNRAVEGDLGDVFYSDSYHVLNGNRLTPSLVGEIGKSNGTLDKGYAPLTSYAIQSAGLVGDNSRGAPVEHTPVKLETPSNDSSAVKALPHLVEKDGLLYVQWHGTQLVYDDTAFTSISGSTGLGGVSVGDKLYVTSGQFQGMRFVMTNTASVTLDNANWYLKPNGYLDYNNSGATYLKIWESDWGDDSEITIVDDESTKTDQNGNTVKVCTHTEMLPIGIANKNQTL